MTFLSNLPHRAFFLEHLQNYLKILNFAEFRTATGTGNAKISSTEKVQRETVLSQSNLFTHSDPASFQQIVYFLFHKLDPDQAFKTFRDAYPVLDKKQEAEFRKKVFVWYKEIQTNNKDVLPVVNVSLFQTPGGKNIITFLHEFAKFVISQKIQKKKVKLKKESEKSLQLNHCDSSKDKKKQILVLKTFQNRNVQKAQECELEHSKLVEDAKIFILENSKDYRQLKLNQKETKNSLEQSLEKTGNSLPEFRKMCQDLKEENVKSSEECQKLANQILEDFEKINSVLEPKSENCNVWDVSEFVLFPQEDTLPQILDRLLATALSLDNDNNENENLPDKNSVLEQKKTFEKHLQSLELKRGKICNETLPKTIERIEHLRSQINIQEGLDFAGLLPPRLPGVNINFDPARNNKRKFNLDRRKPKESQIKTSDKRSTNVTKQNKAENFTRMFTLPSVDSVEDNNSFSKDSLSKHSVLHPGNQFSDHLANSGDRRKVSTNHVICDDSRMSAFSPILSSSRMEPPPTTHPATTATSVFTGGDLSSDQAAGHNVTNFDDTINNWSQVKPSTSSNFSYASIRSDLEEGASRSGSLKCGHSDQVTSSESGISSFVSPKTTRSNFQRFKLSPDFLGNKLLSDQQDSEKSHPPTKANSHDVTTRLNDLMNTLALDNNNSSDNSMNFSEFNFDI